MVENYWQPLSPAPLLVNESLHRQRGKYVWVIKDREAAKLQKDSFGAGGTWSAVQHNAGSPVTADHLL